MPINLVAVATLRRVRLYQGQPATSVATVYTVPAGTDVKVTEVLLCNTTGSPATVTVHAVPSGGTAGAGNRVLSAMSVAANETVVIGLSTYLAPADFLAASQGTSGAVTVTISGETYA